MLIKKYFILSFTITLLFLFSISTFGQIKLENAITLRLKADSPVSIIATKKGNEDYRLVYCDGDVCKMFEVPGKYGFKTTSTKLQIQLLNSESKPLRIKRGKINKRGDLYYVNIYESRKNCLIKIFWKKPKKAKKKKNSLQKTNKNIKKDS